MVDERPVLSQPKIHLWRSWGKMCSVPLGTHIWSSEEVEATDGDLGSSDLSLKFCAFPRRGLERKARRAEEEPGEWWSLRGRTYQEGIRSHPWLPEGRRIALCYALRVPRATPVLLWLLWVPWGSWSSLGKLPGVERGANKWEVCITNF